MTSASPDTAVRRQSQVPTPATYTSVSMGSPRKATETVRSVFSCVASRNRMVSLGTPTGPFGQEIGTGSAGREKKGRLFAVQPPTKVRPCAHPPEALRAWAQRPAMQSIATGSEDIFGPRLGRVLPLAAASGVAMARATRRVAVALRAESAAPPPAENCPRARCRAARENWVSL